MRKTRKKSYINPDKGVPILRTCGLFLLNRGITKETVVALGEFIRSDSKGNLLFLFRDEGNEVVLTKQRFLSNTANPKTMATRGGKAVLMKLPRKSDDDKLYITEGEIDAFTLWQECDVNVASIPMGSNNTDFIEHDWNYLQTFKEIVLIGDNDKAGVHFVDTAFSRLRTIASVKTVYYDNFDENADINAIFMSSGTEGLNTLLETEESLETDKLINMADVAWMDLIDKEAIPSSYLAVNKEWGGYGLHEFTVMTGIQGSGKTTLLASEICSALDGGYKVGILSGEQSNQKYKNWISQIAVGKEGLLKHIGSYDREIHYVDPKHRDKLDLWFDNGIFMIPTGEGLVKSSDVLDLIRYGYVKKGIQFWVIDNMMSLDMDYNGDKFDKQAQLMQDVANLVKNENYPIHIVVVVHQKKSSDIPTKSGTTGATDILNWAHNILGIVKLNSQELRDKVEDKGYHGIMSSSSAMLALLKNREYGRDGIGVGLTYDDKSRRLYQTSNPTTLTRRFAWDTAEDMDVPF
jgi:hypothetical protein